MRFWNFLREREGEREGARDFSETFLFDCWVHVMLAHTHACQSKASHILFLEVLHSMFFFSFLFFCSYLSAFFKLTRIITPMQSEALGGWKKWCHSEDKHFIFSQKTRSVKEKGHSVVCMSLHNKHKPCELVSQLVTAPLNCLDKHLQVIWCDVGKQRHFWLEKQLFS